jgi:hypothetical protein
MENFSAISWREEITFWWDNDDDYVHDALHQDTELNFNSASSMIQQSTSIHYIDAEPTSLPLTHYWCVLRGEIENTKLKIFVLTRSWLKPMIYHTNHYTTYADFIFILCKFPFLIKMETTVGTIMKPNKKKPNECPW